MVKNDKTTFNSKPLAKYKGSLAGLVDFYLLRTAVFCCCCSESKLIAVVRNGHQKRNDLLRCFPLGDLRS